MAYFVIGMFFLFSGMLLLTRERGEYGVPLFINFGEQNHSVGVVCLGVAAMALWKWWRWMKDGK